MPDSLQQVARLLADSLEPAARALTGGDAATLAFVKRLGWTLPSVPPSLTSLGATVNAISDARVNLDLNLTLEASGGAVSANIAGQYLELASNVAALITQLRQLPSSLNAELPAAFVAATNIGAQLPGRLLDLGIYELMVRSGKRLEPVLRLAGIIEVVDEPANPALFRPAYERRTIRWDRLGQFLKDPSTLLSSTYGWGTAAFDGRAFLDAVMHLSFMLAGPAAIDWPSPQRVQAITGALPGFDAVGPPQLTVPLIRQGPLLAEAALLPLPPSGGAPPGLAIALSVNAAVPPAAELSDLLTLQLDDPPALAAGVSIVLRPGRAPQARLGLEGPAGSNVSGGRTGATLKIGRAEPMALLNLFDVLRLETKAVTVSAGVSASATGPYFDVGVVGGKLTLALGGRDGFLERIIPGGPLELGFDLNLEWTSAGVALRGSGELALQIPLHQDLAIFELESLYLVGGFSDNGLNLETSIGAKARLGPIAAAVDRVGLEMTVRPTQGNLGPLDLQLGFKPPNGVGLSIDAGIAKGAGYLYFDRAREEYGGALELSIAGIVTVKAIGIITTKMPDGTKGFSLLIIITAEFGTGIQLGFGFTLLGLGGLLGLNRTMNLQPLVEGVRTGSINSIMFPEDPVANAPRIISDLRVIFPAYEGRFLIGPMAKLGWGTPTLVSVSIGIIIEITGNIAILGVLKIALPAAEAPLIVIQANFAGAIEFDKQRLYFFAGLFESRIVFLTLEGELGLLVAWGGDANFVVSVGGFHPRYNPPPLPFPSPKRIAVSILNTDIARIRTETYFAVTSNSVQFGAGTEIMFDVGVARVDGHLAFDALFQFSPFFFVIQISAAISLKVFGIGLFSIGLEFALEGPSPYRAHGTGTLSLFFFDVSADFDITWGESKDTTLPPIAVMPLLRAEIEKLDSWKAELPAGSGLLVSLRQLPEGESAHVLHPLGSLRVSQRAVPLDLKIDKVGNQAPSDANRYTLTPTAGLVKVRDADEQFAKAQYLKMSDAEKLSQRAFDPLPGGVLLASGGQRLGASKMAKRRVRYEQIIIDSNYLRFKRRFRSFTSGFFEHFLRGTAVTKSELSHHYKTQLDPFVDKVKVREGGFTVAHTENNRPYSAQAAHFASEAQASAFVSAQVSAHPELHGTLHVIPQHEATT